MEEAQRALDIEDIETYLYYTYYIELNRDGHLNYQFFWEGLSPIDEDNAIEPTDGELFEQILTNFGSFKNFKEIFTATAKAIQVSGWVWLCYDV